MTNVKGYFSGNFIKAEECKGGEICEILAEGVMEEITSPEGKAKAVLNYQVSIDGIERTFTPNKSNGQIMMGAWGEDDSKWLGRKFQIKLVDTIAFGKRKKSIVVEPLEEKAEKKK